VEGEKNAASSAGLSRSNSFSTLGTPSNSQRNSLSGGGNRCNINRLSGNYSESLGIPMSTSMKELLRDDLTTDYSLDIYDYSNNFNSSSSSSGKEEGVTAAWYGKHLDYQGFNLIGPDLYTKEGNQHMLMNEIQVRRFQEIINMA
jgi:hypothetical protein